MDYCYNVFEECINARNGTERDLYYVAHKNYNQRCTFTEVFDRKFAFYTILTLSEGKVYFSLHTLRIVNCKGTLIYLHKINANFT